LLSKSVAHGKSQNGQKNNKATGSEKNHKGCSAMVLELSFGSDADVESRVAKSIRSVL
jgi:hypothetical protein